MRARVFALLALLVGAGVLGCGSSRPTPGEIAANGAPIVVDSDRFPHELHTGSRPEIRTWKGRGLGCIECHDAKAVQTGMLARPGTSQHAPCDDGQCHKTEFEKPPGLLCKVCHASVNPTAAGQSPLQSYPSRGTVQTVGSMFSHQQHLDADAMETATGAHVACADCHERDATGDPQPSGHKACLRCHEQQATVAAKLPMTKCAGCHGDKPIALRTGRRLITGDLKFAHAGHQTDQAGNAVACSTCHNDIEDSTSRDDVAVPAMVRCATCHEDSARSPARVRIANCGVCHAKITDGTPPSNHAVSGALPTDHTFEFRRSHAKAAAAGDAKCRFCHTEVSGAPEDSCFQCHQRMRPRDHNVMFRDDHGRAAQTDSNRCASCHTPETCIACHSVPPRSHTPLADFRLGGHAQEARFGLTSCLTCHTYETTCAKCHRGAR